MQALCILAVVLVSVSLYVVANETVAEVDSRSIFGGHNAPRHSFYVFLSIYQGSSDHSSSCGGTILAENVVVTAAHCLYHSDLGRWATPTEILVMVSDFTDPSWKSKTTNYRVQESVTHYKFNTDCPYRKHDIALLVVEGNFNMNIDKALPICAGNENSREAMAIGMGKLGQSPDRFPTVLQQVVLYEDGNCRAKSWSQVCFGDPGRKSVCSGDSGGPLVANIGSQSECLFGIGSIVRCDHPKLPSVFTTASYFRYWINEQLRNTRPEG